MFYVCIDLFGKQARTAYATREQALHCCYMFEYTIGFPAWIEYK